MPGIARSEFTSKADAVDVYRYLLSGAGLGYQVSPARGSPDTLVFSTGMSAFSWGERIEVSVVSQSKGCKILFRGSRVLIVNLTSNPRTPVEKIAVALAAKFGPLTPV